MDPADFDPLRNAMGGDSIALALFELSAVVTGRSDAVEVGFGQIDHIAQSIDDVSISGLIDVLFGEHGFRGDVVNYHAEENSLLDQVLERRQGMPITLSAVAIAVGRQVGLPLRMIAMPGHVVVGLDESDRFIDAFGGVEVDGDGLAKRFASIFGADASFTPEQLTQLDAAGAVNRVCNNLLRTWSDDRSGKIDRLLELRAAIPGSDADRTLVIGIAEARGRFDIAASLREQMDPEDPQISELWARLN